MLDKGKDGLTKLMLFVGADSLTKRKKNGIETYRKKYIWVTYSEC